MTQPKIPAHVAPLFSILEVLFEEQEKAFSSQNPESVKYRDILETLALNRWNCLTTQEMVEIKQEWGGNRTIDFERRAGSKILFLPPLELEPGFFPVMWMNCDGKTYCTTIRIIMLKHKGADIRPPDKVYWGFNFRIESPHTFCPGINQGIRHEFYHTQLSKNFGLGGAEFYDTIDWLPNKQPSFPLLATDPITMVFTLILTLYGKKYFLDIIGKLHDKHLNGLPHVKIFMECINQ